MILLSYYSRYLLSLCAARCAAPALHFGGMPYWGYASARSSLLVPLQMHQRTHFYVVQVLERLLSSGGRGTDAVHGAAQRLLMAFQLNLIF